MERAGCPSLRTASNDSPFCSNGSTAVSESSRALKRSIRSHGGSTAELFSAVLRDHQDVETMGDTLQREVDDIVQNTKSALTRPPVKSVPPPPGCMVSPNGSGRTEVENPETVRLAHSDSEGPLPVAFATFLPSPCATPEKKAYGRGASDLEEVAERVAAEESEALSKECSQLEARLAARQAEVQELKAELDQTQLAATEAHRVLATLSFEEVQQHLTENSRLRSHLADLQAAAAAAPVAAPSCSSSSRDSTPAFEGRVYSDNSLYAAGAGLSVDDVSEHLRLSSQSSSAGCGDERTALGELLSSRRSSLAPSFAAAASSAAVFHTVEKEMPAPEEMPSLAIREEVWRLRRALEGLEAQ
eukprot:TRINITY_DN21742_c0_g1_i2.p1 TRINITY_DN21742_c0_g1~~TRINITY_DN21742_c0_g1_i2.p1  ORF type:complete len:359 (-),score=97.23 TRINITY_DN21742_c0_g1_i2:81-1157(-)